MHPRTRRSLRRGAAPILAAAVCAGAGLAAAGPAAAAAPGPSKVVGHVYVDDNTAGANTIAGFDRHADGALTPIPGSPFAAGGAGTGGGLPSQGAVQLTGDGRFVLAVDAGSDELSVLRVHPDGSLTAVGAPTPSGGSEPVSVAEHDGLVYVANAGAAGAGAGADYTGFGLSAAGTLTPLAGSTVPLPSDAAPGDVLFNANGTRLVGTRVGTSQIDSFAVDRAGLLTVGPGSPVAAQGTGPFGSAFRPTNPRQLFVTNAHNAPGDSTVSTFADGAAGTLSPIAASPVANGQSGTCWAVVSPDGQRLYTVNTGSGTITNYAIAADGSLTVIGSTPILNGTGAGNAVDVGISPDGRYLYVDESKTGAVAEFVVHGSQLRELASDPAPLPAGAAAAGIAVS
jgi:6-phosphogluconolactonase